MSFLEQKWAVNGLDAECITVGFLSDYYTATRITIEEEEFGEWYISDGLGYMVGINSDEDGKIVEVRVVSVEEPVPLVPWLINQFGIDEYELTGLIIKVETENFN